MKKIELNNKPCNWKNDPIVSNWLLSIGASSNTERNYLLAIKVFCEFTDKTPDELILEAEQEVKSGLLMRQRHIKAYLINFKKFLQDQNCAGAPRSKLAGYVRASTQNSVKEGDNHNMV